MEKANILIIGSGIAAVAAAEAARKQDATIGIMVCTDRKSTRLNSSH